MIIELCPKCNSKLLNLVLTSYPPIYVKQCTNLTCGYRYSESENLETKDFIEQKGESINV